MENRRTVLLVEENEADRAALCSFLTDAYSLLSVESAGRGLRFLNQSVDQICLILVSASAACANENAFLRAARGGAATAENAIRLRETSTMLLRLERDPLTGIYTRDFFQEYVAQCLNAHPETAYDMVCMEMESYQWLHGRYGVDKCNLFIRNMVKTLSMCLPEDVIIGRLEDSQVAFLMKHMPFQEHKEFMQRCLFMAKDSPYPKIILNVGVYLNVNHTLSVETICEHALLPIQGIRYQPGVFIAEYDDVIRQQVRQRRVLLKSMYAALHEKQFVVYYQPKVESDAFGVYGAEALVRWEHPEMGFMNPEMFIPLFEQNGFIYELDKYVLEMVCADLRRWMDEGLHVVPVSVNVSQTDFDQWDLDEVFGAIVDSYQLPHSLIHFEITESAEAPDTVKKSTIIGNLRRKGFEIELDDFGAGYSTLSILGKLPMDALKIDMSLIRNMFQPTFGAILRGALYTADKLGMRVIAEGVETPEQVEALRGMRQEKLCLEMQGFYFSRPLPSEQFAGKLRTLPRQQSEEE